MQKIPPKRRWVWFGIFGLLGIFLFLFYRSDGLFRGRAPYGVNHVFYVNMSKSKPWIDIKLPMLGQFRFPDTSVPFDAQPHDHAPDAAGLLYVETGIDIGSWRVNGKEFTAEAGFRSNRSVSGGDPRKRRGWSVSYIPFAPSPDKRDAEISLGGQWYRVVLPSNAKQSAPRKPIEIKTTLGTVIARPEVKASRISDFKVGLTMDSPRPRLLIADLQVTNSYSERQVSELFGPKPISLEVTHSRPRTLFAEVHEFEEVPMKVRWNLDRSKDVLELQGSQGTFKEIRSRRDFAAFGIIAMNVNGRVWEQEGWRQRGAMFKGLEPNKVYPATGYRSTLSSTFELKLDATWP